jgi:hypothetical protein
MNIILDNNYFAIQNVFFLEKMNNVVIDGFFSKIIVSDEFFTMNGLFLNLPLIVNESSTVNQYNKQIINFNSHIQNNLLLITKISEIENSIIHYYKKIHDIKKKTSLVLTTQLFNGYFKIYKENGYFSNYRTDIGNCSIHPPKLDHIITKTNKKYIIKISGLWENKEEVGISYKFIEVTS